MALRKKAPLAKRIKEVEKEMSTLDESIRSLAKSASKQGPKRANTPGGTPVDPEVDTALDIDEKVKVQGERLRDERFADYLSSSFQTVRPLKHERRTQRNKAIVMVGVVLVVLFWFLSRFVWQ